MHNDHEFVQSDARESKSARLPSQKRRHKITCAPQGYRHDRQEYVVSLKSVGEAGWVVLRPFANVCVCCALDIVCCVVCHSPRCLPPFSVIVCRLEPADFNSISDFKSGISFRERSDFGSDVYTGGWKKMSNLKSDDWRRRPI